MSLILNWLESMQVDLKISEKCSKKKNRHSTCTYCLQACNDEAISINNGSIAISPEICSSCGDCMVACPLSAITGMAITRQFENGSLVYDASYIPTVKELLIYKKRGMHSIQMAAAFLNPVWEKVLNETNEGLAILGEESIMVFRKETDERLSRRAFFTSFQKEGKHMLKSLAPAAWKIKEDEWNLANYYPDYQFYTVVINQDKCTLCQLCKTLCPQHVFSLGESEWQIEHGKCANCTVCRDICPEQAIEITPEIKKKNISRHHVQTQKCTHCGQSFYGFHEEENCPLCRDRDPEWLSPFG